MSETLVNHAVFHAYFTDTLVVAALMPPESTAEVAERAVLEADEIHLERISTVEEIACVDGLQEVDVFNSKESIVMRAVDEAAAATFQLLANSILRLVTLGGTDELESFLDGEWLELVVAAGRQVILHALE